jgi:LacI family transcriptional regulator
MINLSTSFGRHIVEGINSYPLRANWELLAESWGDIGADDLVTGENADGLIVDASNKRLVELLKENGKPTVVIAGSGDNPQWSSVTPDFSQIGVLAAQHFLENGFRRFAFLAVPHNQNSKDMELSFSKTVQEAGASVTVHSTRISWSGNRKNERQKLLEWLTGLEFPCAIFAADDIIARRVLQACRMVGFRIPEQFAVLGVGDYEVVNTLTRPPLSTVIVAARQIGVQAAEVLSKMLTTPNEENIAHIRIPSPSIAARRSTDLFAWDDPIVIQALSWLKTNCADKVGIPDLAEALSFSRRRLEQRFRATVGHGPGEELRRIRLRLAQQLLTETDWSLGPVARASGIQSAERLCALFRERVGMTPNEFRRQTSQNNFYFT